MTELSKAPSRQLMWGGLVARCSECGWTRTYQPGVVVHKLPNAELAEAIRSEHEIHKCDEFLVQTQRPSAD
jgi:hypothetical protein